MSEGLFWTEISAATLHMKACFWDMESRIRQCLSVEEIYDIRSIYMTGCGDSHMAAVCASMAFSRLTGCSVFTPTAMEQSFYTFPAKPEKNSLVIGLSNSGETSRTVEALMRMGRRGCKTMALTCKANSRLAGAADKVFLMDIPKLTDAPVPGVRGLVIPLAALYLLAIRMGEVKGIVTMDEAGSLRRELYSMADMMGGGINAGSQAEKEFLLRCIKAPVIEFLAAGPSMGAALFAVAKLTEAAGICGKAVDLEEFCHVEYFEREPLRLPTVVLGGRGQYCEFRSMEVKKILESLGRPALYIEAPPVNEMWVPLILCIAAAGMAAGLCDVMEGESASRENYFRGFHGLWENGRCPGVKDSQLNLTIREALHGEGKTNDEQERFI